MKTPRGTARALRRESMSDFHHKQCARRDATQDNRLFGDGFPRGELPKYYLDYLKQSKGH